MSRFVYRFFMFLVLVIVILSLSFSTISRAETAAISEESDIDALDQDAVIEDLRWLVDDDVLKGHSYHTKYGYDETKCEPADFKRDMEIAMNISEEERAESMHALLSSLGFARDEWAERYMGDMNEIELIEYGQVLDIEGKASVSLVQLYGFRNYFIYVFVERSSGWFLMDRFWMDDWELNDQQYPALQLIQHCEGKPGAWLQVRSVVHGTAIYSVYFQWYNVFTRQYDLSYIRRGQDGTGRTNNNMFYIVGWRTELGFSAAEVDDILHFITYEGITRHPYDEADDAFGEEVASSMTLYEYRYDEQTASYVCTMAEQRPLMSPGSVDVSYFLFWDY